MPRFPLVSGERRPDLNMTALIFAGDGAGAIIAVSLLVLGLVGIPEARLFFLASASARRPFRTDPVVEASLIHSDEPTRSVKN